MIETQDELLRERKTIEAILGYSFKNPDLLLLPFVHCSYLNEHPSIEEDNERLEFLGDSVFGLLISSFLYETLPSVPEGELSMLKAKIVEANSCYQFIQSLDLEKYLLLGKGEKLNLGRGRESILANLFEAIIGAIYLDGGLDAAKQYLFSRFQAQIDAIIKNPERNWKAKLQDHCQKEYQMTPVYEVVNESGPEHQKTFVIAVKIGERILGIGEGNTKKYAQQEAAKIAYHSMENHP